MSALWRRRRGARPGTTRARDVAIYSPDSAYFFEGDEAAAESLMGISGGGAELQMVLVARGLIANGIRVALIVFPVRGGRAPGGQGPDLIERAAYAGNRSRTGEIAESIHIWRAMRDADAAVYVFRGSGPQLFVAAVFCRLHRRKLIFSAANDLDFDFARPDRTRSNLAPYQAALRRVDLVIVQREEQLELARGRGLDPLELIPSVAETAGPSRAEPEAFLWIGRVVDYKRPLEFVKLAESLPNIPFRMIYFSSDETRPELAEELQAAGEKLENLELLGRMPRGEVLDQVARAVALISTSEAEGMPNVFLESWARGVPVISLQYDPDRKISSLGLGLVAGGSAERLGCATASLWRNSSRRTELGANAREYVRSAHSPEVIARRWAEVIRELLRESAQAE